VKSLFLQSYKNIEIIIVDDGSTDKTKLVGEELAQTHQNVVFLKKENGGKARALNLGIKNSTGSIVVCMDADSMFLEDTVKNLVISFDNPEVMAVAGNVKIANRSSLLCNEQAVEYVAGLTLQRQAFAALNCVQVMSGALATFRRSTLESVGFYSPDTLVEDMDITIACALKGHKVVYNPKAIAYTEGPGSWRDLLKQRHRWVFGGFQVIKKYQFMISDKKYKNMAFVGLPYFAIFPWLDVLASLLLVIAVMLSVITDSFHILMLFLFVMLLIQTVVVWYACHLDEENPNLIWYSILSTFFYSHLLNYVTVRAGWAYFFNKEARWDKLKRSGANVLNPSMVIPSLILVKKVSSKKNTLAPLQARQRL